MKRSALAFAVTLMVGCAGNLPTNQNGSVLSDKRNFPRSGHNYE